MHFSVIASIIIFRQEFESDGILQGMEKDILSMLSHVDKGFSKGQKQIAKFIVENYDKAAFMTACKLGRTVGVSESTVVRFASELGFEGYPEMRKALQEMIRNRLTSVQRIEVSKELITNTNTLKDVLTADIEKLRATLENIDMAQFDAAVDAILSAKRIYIVGMRASTALASFMGFYMNLFLDNVKTIHENSANEVYEQIMRIGEGDVLIGISFPRYSTKTFEAMEYAKKRGATAIGITDNDNSPLHGIADICLYAKSDMVSFVDSLVAPLSLINALIVSVGMHSQEGISNTFMTLEQLWTDYDVFTGLES